MMEVDVFIPASLFFITGILAGLYSTTALNWAVFIFLCSLLFLCLIILRTKKLIFFICPLLFCIAFLRAGVSEQKLIRPGLNEFSGQKIKTEAWVCQDPDRLESSQKVVLCLFYPKTRVLVKTDLYPRLIYGQRVMVEGRLKSPEPGPDFDYAAWLARRKIYFLMSYPRFKILPGKVFTLKTGPVYLKNGLEMSLEKITSFPEAGFFEALLFGDEDNIPDSWKEKLNRSGVRHIVAVSGTNLTILAGLVLEFFLFLGLWRQQAFWATLVFMTLYVVMIGAPACAIRAAIMGALLLTATYCGRVPDEERLALLTLCAMLFVSPLLVFDLGFKLSFLAFLGLIYLSPLLSRFFRNVPEIFAVRESLVTTLSAQLFVLPLLFFSFERLSLAAPFANILILPFVPFLTVSAFIASLAGLVHTGLGILLILPAYLVLTVLMKIIDFWAGLRWAEVFFRPPFWTGAVFYALLFVLVLKSRSQRYPNA